MMFLTCSSSMAAVWLRAPVSNRQRQYKPWLTGRPSTSATRHVAANFSNPKMATERERCEEVKRFRQINDAFLQGDLEALRAAVDDPALVPNGRLPDTHRKLSRLRHLP